jgi:hypothetical protein
MIHENILYGYDYDDIENKLTAREDIKNYGFFSTFTLLLTSIMTVYRKFGKTPDIIDCKKGMAKFKNEENFDLYHHFFHINNDIEINFDEELPVPLSPDDHHTVYSEKYINWCEFYIASLWIQAKSKYVITYTGNSSFFVYLVRQTTKNFIQEITFTKNYNDFFINEN